MPTPEKEQGAARRRQTKSWILLTVLLSILAALIVRQRATLQDVLSVQQNNRTPVARQAFRPVSQGFDPVVVIRSAFPPITDVPVAQAEEVADPDAKERIQDNELVLGIAQNGEARAYPINMLTGPEREIINDTVGGVALAATW